MTDIVSGEVYRLSDRVRRISANNGGVMTGPGTNTYLLGQQRVAVIDPGPADQQHMDAIVAAAEADGGRIEWVLVTHTHQDHSPAARPLAERCGAELIGANPPEDPFQDLTFRVENSLRDEDILRCEEFTLRAVYTPGHVDNHFCFFLEEEGMMMTGDHLMNGSTVVIIPPYGDMAAYIQSLRRLLEFPMQAIAPGHGALILDPAAIVEWTIEHRLQREAKVLAALSSSRQSLDELVAKVYDDVHVNLHTMAKYSLLAHLFKLRAESRAEFAAAVDAGSDFHQRHWFWRICH